MPNYGEETTEETDKGEAHVEGTRDLDEFITIGRPRSRISGQYSYLLDENETALKALTRGKATQPIQHETTDDPFLDPQTEIQDTRGPSAASDDDNEDRSPPGKKVRFTIALDDNERETINPEDREERKTTASSNDDREEQPSPTTIVYDQDSDVGDVVQNVRATIILS